MTVDLIEWLNRLLDVAIVTSTSIFMILCATILAMILDALERLMPGDINIYNFITILIIFILFLALIVITCFKWVNFSYDQGEKVINRIVKYNKTRKIKNVKKGSPVYLYLEFDNKNHHYLPLTLSRDDFQKIGNCYVNIKEFIFPTVTEDLGYYKGAYIKKGGKKIQIESTDNHIRVKKGTELKYVAYSMRIDKDTFDIWFC